MRIDIRRKEVIKEGQDIVGNRVKVKIVKNKVAPPFKEVEFDIMYNEGISKIGDMLDVATEYGVIQKSGSWYSFGKERAQGRDGLKKILIDNPEVYQEVETKVREILTNGSVVKSGLSETEE